MILRNFGKKNIPWDNQHSGTNCGSKNRAQKAIYEYHEYFWCYPETKPWEASPIKAGWLLESGGHREMQIDCL